MLASHQRYGRIEISIFASSDANAILQLPQLSCDRSLLLYIKRAYTPIIQRATTDLSNSRLINLAKAGGSGVSVSRSRAYDRTMKNLPLPAIVRSRALSRYCVSVTATGQPRVRRSLSPPPRCKRVCVHASPGSYRRRLIVPREKNCRLLRASDTFTLRDRAKVEAKEKGRGGGERETRRRSRSGGW